jgi:3D (Asp-Asp-Asp) domain-containing protein
LHKKNIFVIFAILLFSKQQQLLKIGVKRMELTSIWTVMQRSLAISGAVIVALLGIGGQVYGQTIANKTPHKQQKLRGVPLSIRGNSINRYKVKGVVNRSLRGGVAAKSLLEDEVINKLLADSKRQSRLHKDSSSQIDSLSELHQSIIENIPGLFSSNANTEADDAQNAMETFVATAYSLRGRMACGEYTRPGVVAADPRILPLGSIIKVDAGTFSGVYHVLDTGGAIKGNKLDIFITCPRQARKFGRRKVQVEVLRQGWGVDPTPKADPTQGLENFAIAK